MYDSHCLIEIRYQQAFCMYFQMVNILGFEGHMIFFATFQI